MDYNSYFFDMDKMSDDGELKHDFIELHSNRDLEIQFGGKTLEVYWWSDICLYFQDFVKLH